MNPDLALLHPYPFEKLRALFATVTPNAAFRPINLTIGEPKHPTPQFIKDALCANVGGLSAYPASLGGEALRTAARDWLVRRYGLPPLDIATQILPITGSREALFAIAQTVVDRTRPDPLVVCPNPFYQIYEGATLLAGGRPLYANVNPARNFASDFSSITPEQWARVQLLYVCSPGNPTGAVMTLDDWRELFALSDRYGFVIASDECYSEIYFRETAPLGGLEAAYKLGREGYPRLISFTSLSKRSNVPGLRSGFVAGDAAILKAFLLYRTYHGTAMSTVVQAASVAAWNDETHVEANRDEYRRKFAEVTPLLQSVLGTSLPDAAFYLWAKVPASFSSDLAFASALLAEYNVAVLPGSYLAREHNGINPGTNHVRIALVAHTAECVEAAQRIVAFVQGRT